MKRRLFLGFVIAFSIANVVGAIVAGFYDSRHPEVMLGDFK